MAKTAEPEPPTVAVMHVGHADLLSAICAGIEEEGVPFSLLPLDHDPASEVAPAVEMAKLAATGSRLGVGVGVDSAGQVVVHHAKLPLAAPALDSRAAITPAQARVFGHNAARIVTGIPLKRLHLT